MIKETEDTNKWKCTPSSWIRRINIVKMSKKSKAIYRFNANTIFTEIEKTNLKFVWNPPPTKTPNSQSNSEKEALKLKASHFHTILKS